MNKKLIFIALSAFLVLTACGKKEQPMENGTTETVKEEKIKAGELTKEQQNLLVFGTILGTSNDMPVNKLEPEAYKEASIQVLNSTWDVSDTAEAKETIEWLLTEGHRNGKNEAGLTGDELLAKMKEDTVPEELSEYSKLYNDVKSNLIDSYGYTEEQINNIKTISSWDYDRLVNVARFSFYAAYITEDEMWDYIKRGADAAKNDYDNWNDYFAGAVLGRALAYGRPFSESQDTANKLLKNDKSVYKEFSFK